MILPKKVVLYMTDQALIAYDCSQHAVIAQQTFHRDGKGIVAFSAFLSDRSEIPFSILINSVEEEYKLETMAHVPKRQSMLLQRQLSKKYRKQTYKYATLQGQEHFGKKDDKILLSTISNDAVLNSWVQPLLEKKISIAAIHSLPISTESLVKKLGISVEKLLVLTHDSDELRFTYLDEGKFKISRQIKTEKTDPNEILQEVKSEIEKTLKYLGRIRLVFPDQKTDVLVISSSEKCKLLMQQDINTSTSTGNWTYCDKTYIEDRLNIVLKKSIVVESFIHVLLNENVINHYADMTHKRFFITRQLRRPLEMGSSVLLLIMAVISGIILIDSQVLDVRLQQLSQKMNVVTSKLISSEASLPSFPVSADAVEAGVKAIDILLKEKPDLKTTFVVLSHTLENFPNIAIDSLQWSVAQRDVVGEVSEELDDVDENAGMDDSGDSTELVDVDVNAQGEKRWVQVISISGQLNNFDGNYSHANMSIDRLVKSLEKNDAFYSAIATKKPISHNLKEKINGAAGKEQDRNKVADFILEIVINESKLS